MTPLGPRRQVRVISDASAFGLSAVEQAVELALRIDADLSGLYLENASLFRLALLPFAQETGSVSGRRRPLEPGALEALSRRQAHRIEQVLAERAGRRGLNWSFRVQRGSLLRDAMSLAAGVDAVLFGCAMAAAGVAPRRRRGGVWVLVLPAQDGGRRAAVARAVRLGLNDCRELLVLVPGAAAADLEHLRPDELPAGAPAVVLRALPADSRGVLEATRRAGAELLMLDGAAPGPALEQMLREVLAQAPCPVLVTAESSAEVGRAQDGGADDAI
jgi:hypothetical protein